MPGNDARCQPQLVSFLIYNDYLIAAWRARCRSRTQSTRTLFPLLVPGISGFLPVYRGNMYSSRLRAFSGTKSSSLLQSFDIRHVADGSAALKLQIVGDDDKFPHWSVTQLHQNGVEDCRIFVSSRSLNAKVWKFYGLSLRRGGVCFGCVTVCRSLSLISVIFQCKLWLGCLESVKYTAGVCGFFISIKHTLKTHLKPHQSQRHRKITPKA